MKLGDLSFKLFVNVNGSTDSTHRSHSETKFIDGILGFLINSWMIGKTKEIASTEVKNGFSINHLDFGSLRTADCLLIVIVTSCFSFLYHSFAFVLHDLLPFG